MYDIAIIGLGPAGATLARLLDKRLRVIAIDKKYAENKEDNATGFQKPCGGLLATDAQKALSKFNLTLPKSVLVDPQIFAVRTIDTKRDLQRYYQRFYINLDRHRFDQWLISLIPPHVQLVQNAACADVRAVDGSYEVSYHEEKTLKKITAKYVVGADGAHSRVRQALFPTRPIRQYLSIQQWFPEQHANPFYSCVFDADITPSYCWSISKDGHFILGGAFPKHAAKQRFELLKEKLHARGFAFGRPLKTEACLVSVPRGLRDFCVGRGEAFLVGEAAGFISPSSLEGISYALNSARALAGILNENHADPSLRYRFKTLPLRGKLLLKYLKSPFMYQPFLRRLVMKSGLASIRVEPGPEQQPDHL